MRPVPITAGDRFGSLTVIHEAARGTRSSGATERRVLCRCDCGTEIVTRLAGLRRGVTLSCGCSRRKTMALENLLAYDPASGRVTWLVDRYRIKAGAEAGSLTPYGYVVIYANHTRYLAHRLAWYFSHGKWPTQQIDHINGDRADNRIANLRDVSHAANAQNRTRVIAASGLLGAFKRPLNKWQARITRDGVARCLGTFNTPEEAHSAFMRAKDAYESANQ